MFETDTKPRIITATTATRIVNGRLTLNFSMQILFLYVFPSASLTRIA